LNELLMNKFAIFWVLLNQHMPEQKWICQD
jgi:hypothetical protein